MIFLHPNSSFIIKPSNPIITLRSNFNQKKNPVFIHFRLQTKKGLFHYNCSIVKMEFLRKLGIGCFGNKDNRMLQIQRNVEVESVDGGEDVMDSAMVEAKLTPQHLVVMVNGLIGSASDWKFAASEFVKQLPDKVMVHCSQSNTAKLTFDGVDLMGERLADEVSTVISCRPELQKISFIAHSLGGLVARYAIGKLYEPLETSALWLQRKTAMMLPFLCGVLFLEKQASQTAHMIAGRSGKHLFLTDIDEGKPPLLLRMASDSYELKFMLANLLARDEKYPHIVFVEHGTLDDNQEMIRGLNRVPWERVDVSFHQSRQRYVAHNTIQASDSNYLHLL
ncbi:hypothetical protein RDABS01_034345 [Bienertia sinuspersici]